MTREEAIAILDDNETVIENPNYLFTEIGEAWDMAIEALKTETKKCPNCGSDLYEYCFMCCYEGKKVRKNERQSRNEV